MGLRTKLLALVTGLLAACTPLSQCLAAGTTGGVAAGLGRAYHGHLTGADVAPDYLSPEEGVPLPDPSHTAVLQGAVGPQVLPLLAVLAASGELAEYPDSEGEQPIVSLVIDSPGGSVTVGRVVTREMDRVRDLGVLVRCYVTGTAASMALQILTHCDERYLAPTARLMWHRPFILLGPLVIPPVRLTGPAARYIADRAEVQDQELYEDLVRSLHGVGGMPEEVVLLHYEEETIWSTGGLLGNAPTWAREMTAAEAAGVLASLVAMH